MLNLDQLDELAERQDMSSGSEYTDGSGDSDVGSKDADAIISENGGLVEFYLKRQARRLDQLLDRYGTVSERSDIVDISTGRILIDHGHLRSLPEATATMDVDGNSDSDSESGNDGDIEVLPRQIDPPSLNLYEDICQRPNVVLDKVVALLC